ncbi:MAG TPA: CDP-alcohol phosphatidyltransferase family protein [Thermomicrobiales bacterium]|nr:CDP-alcohol phosphatidyltransferase family protein [Thermomicrobiales bacterium]
MISEPIGRAVRQYMLGVGRALARLGITPNMATLIGFGLNVVVALVLASGYPRIAGVMLLVASAFDMVDGAIARSTGTTSSFGGFLDSTVDRYSEIVVYIGLLVWLNTTDNDHLGSLLVLVSATGALMISYARARAEAIGHKASVGLVARPERVVLLGLCLIFNLPMVALWILAVTTHLTAVWRMIHVWRVTSTERPASN